MIFKVTVLVIVAFVQANEVLSQRQQQQQVPQYQQYGAEMWDPSSWATHYTTAFPSAWVDYFKKAAQVSEQLYKQWDKTGASNFMSAGMGFAQHWATEAQKAAQAAMKHAQAGTMGMIN